MSLSTIFDTKKLSRQEISSVVYHNIFDYPLKEIELKKWKTKKSFVYSKSEKLIEKKKGYYFVKGRGDLVAERLAREKISKRKFTLAKKTANLLRKIPMVLFVGVTGSLAMNNSKKDSDIDFLIISKRNSLWFTRMVGYIILWANGIRLRQPKKRDEEDKLCLNVWLDESTLTWDKKNLFTAHEIAQITPLVNKGEVFQKFLLANRWIRNFWPNATFKGHESGTTNQETGLEKKRIVFDEIIIPTSYFIIRLIEPLCFWAQKQYMKSKMTNEIVKKNKAIFHPSDWTKIVLQKLKI